MALSLACSVGGCAGQPRAFARREPSDVVASFEVRLPADAYTPLAQALPVLHEIGGRICHNSYRIVDRWMRRSAAIEYVYQPRYRAVLPVMRPSWEIAAKMECVTR